ncbi:hypothetical protein AAON49_09670 [Pseudotenacibaculum sp. MALMAid0570]|uniref:hypothetical protein n=1 Tax=Pseudotenacibaculum sp. MALMAid0570 TaxID=3143938 RepID=UPI0032DF46A5
MKNIREQLKHKAYLEGLKFKNSGLEEDVIYAKLEKKGFPIQLAKEVAKNIVLERKKVNKEQLTDYKNIGFVLFFIWLIVSTVAYYYTGNIYFAFELLVVIVPSVFLVHSMTTDK